MILLFLTIFLFTQKYLQIELVRLTENILALTELSLLLDINLHLEKRNEYLEIINL